MSDLYERLLVKVEDVRATPPPCTCGECGDEHVAVAAADVLTARLEAHSPDGPWCDMGGFDAHQHCAGCGWVWPCEKVRAIARALDVPIGDQQ